MLDHASHVLTIGGGLGFSILLSFSGSALVESPLELEPVVGHAARRR